jgi:hypothetical protein
MVAHCVQILRFHLESSETWLERPEQIRGREYLNDARLLFWRVGSSLCSGRLGGRHFSPPGGALIRRRNSDKPSSFAVCMPDRMCIHKLHTYASASTSSGSPQRSQAFFICNATLARLHTSCSAKGKCWSDLWISLPLGIAFLIEIANSAWQRHS